MAVRTQAAAAPSHKKIYRHLHVQVLRAIAIGVLLGHFYPEHAPGHANDAFILAHADAELDG